MKIDKTLWGFLVDGGSLGFMKFDGKYWKVYRFIFGPALVMAFPIHNPGAPKDSTLSCTRKRGSASEASGGQPSPKRVAPAETQDAGGVSDGE